MKGKALLSPLFSFLLIPFAKAHCPLCTAGAVVAAGGAAYFGVSQAIIGVFIGAFAVSMGWMIAKWFRRNWLKWPLIVFSIATTIWPLRMMMQEVQPLYVSWIGAYGTTFVIPTFIAGSFLGGIMVCLAPWLSRKIALKRGKLMPYQGIALTFILLAISSGLIEVIL
jgi:hypothetical protein